MKIGISAIRGTEFIRTTKGSKTSFSRGLLLNRRPTDGADDEADRGALDRRPRTVCSRYGHSVTPWVPCPVARLRRLLATEVGELMKKRFVQRMCSVTQWKSGRYCQASRKHAVIAIWINRRVTGQESRAWVRGASGSGDRGGLQMRGGVGGRLVHAGRLALI